VRKKGKRIERKFLIIDPLQVQHTFQKLPRERKKKKGKRRKKERIGRPQRLCQEQVQERKEKVGQNSRKAHQ